MNPRAFSATTHDAAVRAFVEEFEQGDRHAAVQTLRERATSPRSILTALFGVGYDGWYALVADDITGRCLDLTAGWGRTTPLLSRLAETVYTYQPTDLGRRFLAARPSLEEGDAVSLVADDLASVVRDRSFETIVTTGPRPPDSDFVSHIDRLVPALTDDGTVITEIDGWPRTTGLTELVGLERSSPMGERRSLATVSRSLPARFTTALEDRGFDDIELFGLLPGGRQYRWVVPIDDPDALEWVLKTIEGETTATRLLRGGAAIANRLGVVTQSYPSYVAVCHRSSRDPAADAGSETEPTRVLRRGANRSIVFELSDGRLETVWKVPNTPRHGRYNQRAATTLSALTASSEPLTGTLPDVTLEPSPLGPTLSEPPAVGTPLANVITRWETPPDPDTFARGLEIGLDWIETLQRTHAGPRKTVAPDAVCHALTPAAFEVTPPPVSEPLEFPTGPAHGDYHPGNVLLADDGSIERVIDWEYSALDRNPIADPGFYVLKLAELAFGDFETGVRAVFLEETPYAQRVRKRLIAYCDAIGVRPVTVGTYLGHALVTQIDVHFEVDSPWRFHTSPREKADRLAFLYDNLDDIVARIDGDRTTSSDDVQSATPTVLDVGHVDRRV